MFLWEWFLSPTFPSVIRLLHQRWRSYNRRRRVVVVSGVLLAAVLTPAIVVVALSKLEPSWWPGPSADSAVTAAQAESLENAALAQASLVRPGGATATVETWFSEPWSVAISEADANAWLESRLPQWIANRHHDAAWSKQFADVRLRFDDGRIDVAARVTTDSGSRIVGVTLRPRIEDDGSLWTPASTLFAGRAALPTGPVMRGLRGRVESALPASVKGMPELDGAFRTLLDEQAAAKAPILRIDGGRRVRLLGIRVREGRVELTCRTEQR